MVYNNEYYNDHSDDTIQNDPNEILNNHNNFIKQLANYIEDSSCLSQLFTTTDFEMRRLFAQTIIQKLQENALCDRKTLSKFKAFDILGKNFNSLDELINALEISLKEEDSADVKNKNNKLRSPKKPVHKINSRKKSIKKNNFNFKKNTHNNNQNQNYDTEVIPWNTRINEPILNTNNKDEIEIEELKYKRRHLINFFRKTEYNFFKNPTNNVEVYMKLWELDKLIEMSINKDTEEIILILNYLKKYTVTFTHFSQLIECVRVLLFIHHQKLKNNELSDINEIQQFISSTKGYDTLSLYTNDQKNIKIDISPRKQRSILNLSKSNPDLFLNNNNNNNNSTIVSPFSPKNNNNPNEQVIYKQQHGHGHGHGIPKINDLTMNINNRKIRSPQVASQVPFSSPQILNSSNSNIQAPIHNTSDYQYITQTQTQQAPNNIPITTQKKNLQQPVPVQTFYNNNNNNNNIATTTNQHNLVQNVLKSPQVIAPQVPFLSPQVVPEIFSEKKIQNNFIQNNNFNEINNTNTNHLEKKQETNPNDPIQILIEYFTNNTLLNFELITVENIKKILNITNTSENTINLCNKIKIKNSSSTYSNINELIKVLNQYMTLKNTTNTYIYSSIINLLQKLFSISENNNNTDIKITEDIIDTIMIDCDITSSILVEYCTLFYKNNQKIASIIHLKQEIIHHKNNKNKIENFEKIKNSSEKKIDQKNRSKKPNICKICNITLLQKYTKSDLHILIEYLNSSECILFRDTQNELKLSKKILIHLIHIGHGLQQTLKHLKGFNAVMRNFKHINDMIQAFIEYDTKKSQNNDQTVTYLSQQHLNEFYLYFHKYKKNFFYSHTSKNIDHLINLAYQSCEFDRLLITTNKNIIEIFDLLDYFVNLNYDGNNNDHSEFVSDPEITRNQSKNTSKNKNKKYINITQIINDIIDLDNQIKQDYQNNPNNINYVIQLLSNISLFDSSIQDDELLITKQHIKQLIYKSHGIRELENHLKWYEIGHRTFKSIHHLIDEISISERTKCHLSSNAQLKIAQYFYKYKDTIYQFPSLDNKLNLNLLNGNDLDLLSQYCIGLQPQTIIRKCTLKFLENENLKKKKFKNFKELINIMANIENNRMSKIKGYNGYECRRCHAPMKKITKIEIKQFMEYFNSEKCKLFSDVEGELKLTRANLDHLCHTAGDTQSTLLLLKHLDAEGRKFLDFDNLINFNKNVHHTIFKNSFKLTGWKKSLIKKMKEIGYERIRQEELVIRRQKSQIEIKIM